MTFKERSTENRDTLDYSFYCKQMKAKQISENLQRHALQATNISRSETLADFRYSLKTNLATRPSEVLQAERRKRGANIYVRFTFLTNFRQLGLLKLTINTSFILNEIKRVNVVKNLPSDVE